MNRSFAVKKILVSAILGAIILLVGACSSTQSDGLEINKLRCEYHSNPPGIDVVRPRLSWILKSDERAQKQKAYQVLVVSSEELLAKNKGDLWDSGKTESNRTSQIVYDGKELKSQQRCYWKVRVWDKYGKPSAWSKPAMWSMGLLDEKLWQGKWIGQDADIKPVQANALKDAQWIWYPEGDPVKGIPDCIRYFRRVINIGADKKVVSARLFMTADNEFTAFINGKQIGQSTFRIPFEVDVAKILKAGRNVIAVEAKNIGYRPTSSAGLTGALEVKFADGSKMLDVTNKDWISHKEKKSGWQEAGFDGRKWKKVKVLGEHGMKPWNELARRKLVLPPAQYMRKNFRLQKKVRRAVVYASALGLYEIRINGNKVGEDYLTPGWTDYDTRVYYNTYDATKLVKKGDNAIGAILADGWYAGYIGWKLQRRHYGYQPLVRAQLYIEYEDGTSEVIATDESWKVNTGAILEADFLMGQKYDALKEMSGWDKAGYDDSGWEPVSTSEDIDAKVEAYSGSPVRKFAEIKPVSMKEPLEGMYVFDMGQNFAGWVKLKVRGAKAGDTISLRFAERLNPDGTIYTMNLRSARAMDTYICKGDAIELWQPQFTFHGFQYVEVKGYPGKCDEDTITGIAISAATPVVGSFECSDKMTNQLYSNICWTQLANFIEVPTDCPQRDERLGWMGDAQIYARTATYNTDVAAFFTKWMVDVEDAQRPDGAFGDYSPRLKRWHGGVAAWADAGVICPWVIYKVYGDKRILEKHYEAMEKWIAYCQQNSDKLLREAKGFGDWLSIEADTPRDVLATAYFARSTKLLEKIAGVLGKQEDAKKYRELFENIKKRFNQAYVDEKGHIKGETQTAYVLALAFDLLPENKRKAAAEFLLEDIKNRDWHPSTGFVGTKDLMGVLTELDRLDVAYRLLLNDTFPSWGFSIKQGATSIWERWDGWRPEKGFQNPAMNSFAHYAFGAVGEWMFKVMAGIDTADAGYEHIIIRPRPGGNVDYVKASYESIHGEISTHWRLDGDVLKLDVTIPVNTTAKIYVPAKSAKDVMESGKPAAESSGVEFVNFEKEAAVYKVGSGNYCFVSKGVKPIMAID